MGLQALAWYERMASVCLGRGRSLPRTKGPGPRWAPGPGLDEAVGFPAAWDAGAAFPEQKARGAMGLQALAWPRQKRTSPGEWGKPFDKEEGRFYMASVARAALFSMAERV